MAVENEGEEENIDDMWAAALDKKAAPGELVEQKNSDRIEQLLDETGINEVDRDMSAEI